MIKKILNINKLSERRVKLSVFAISRAKILYHVDKNILRKGYSESSGQRYAVLFQTAFSNNSTPGIKFLKALVNGKTLDKHLCQKSFTKVSPVKKTGDLILLYSIQFIFNVITQIINYPHTKFKTLVFPISVPLKNHTYKISTHFQGTPSLNRLFKTLLNLKSNKSGENSLSQRYEDISGYETGILRKYQNEGYSKKSFKAGEFSGCNYFNKIKYCSFSHLSKCHSNTRDVGAGYGVELALTV